MKDNRVVLKHCPNFYKIINFEYYEDDYISAKLISIYENYIFNVDVTVEENLVKVSCVDQAIAKYIDDYIFRKEMKNELVKLRVKKSENIFDTIINYIISIFNRYEEGSTRQIYLSRWI